MRKEIRKIMLSVTVLISILLLVSCSKQGQDGNGGGGAGGHEFVAPVEVIPLERNDIIESVELVGTVRGHNRVTISSELQGVVSDVVKREGEAFKKGEVLLNLDETDFKLNYDMAAADLEMSEQNLKDLVRGTRKEVIEQLRASLKRQEAALKNADLELKRAQELFKDDVNSQAALDQAHAVNDQAAASVMEAKARLEEAENGATAEEIASAKAVVQVKKASLAMARRNLEKTSVTALFNGVVVSRFVEKGAYVGPGTPLFDIVSTDALDIFFDIPEKLVDRMKVGSPVRIISDSFPEMAIDLDIKAIIPAADEASRNFPARCYIENDPRLKPGMLVRVTAQVDSRENVLTVSQDALMNDKGQYSIYVVRDGQAAIVPVQTGLTSVEAVEISGEVKEGEPVIVVGNEIVFPGAKVRIIDPNAPMGPPPGMGPGAEEDGSVEMKPGAAEGENQKETEE